MPEVNFNLLNPNAELYSGPQVQMDPVAAYEKAKATRQSNMLAQLYAKHYDPQTGGVNYNALIGDAAQSDLAEHIPSILGEKQKQDQALAQQQHYVNLAAQEKAAANLHDVEAKQKEADAKHADLSRAIGDVAKYTTKEAALSGIEQKLKEGKIDQESHDNLVNMISNEPSWSKSQRNILNSLLSAKEQLETMQSQEPKLGTYQPGDYTTASWAKFVKTKDPTALQLKPTASQIAATTEKPLTPAQQQKLKSAKAEDVDKYNSISQTATDLANLRDQLIGNPATGKAEHPGLGAITGWSALLPLEKIPESDASAASTILETIKGKVNALGRQIASVHGKLGNMAVQEWKILADSVQKIDPKAKNFADQINNIVTTAEDLQRNSRGRFQYEYDEDVPVIAPPAAGGGAQTTPAVGGSNIPTVTTQKQYDALPKGAQFYEDGKLYRKP